jgi:hypothetical protein
MAIIREFPPPAKAGIYDLEASYYHSIEAMNKSSLVYFDRSPAHYQAYLKEGGMVPTRDMLIGTAFDLLVFSPERFKTQVVVDLTTNKNKKEYKVWREAQADDAVIISQASYDNVRRMRDEMMKKEQIAELMTEGYGQRSVFWQDPRTNIWCKARPDWITPQAITVDLKKARDASYRGFGRQAGNLKYHWQAAWYLMGLTLVTGIEHLDFRFVAVEDKPPYESAVYRCDLDQIKTAQDHMEMLLDKFEMCVEHNWWPGYPDELQDLGIPIWELNKDRIVVDTGFDDDLPF